jgi:16S rRNA (guanine527-N7)-methyltransferase
VEAAKRDWPAAFRMTRDVSYTIPATPHARRLVVLERLPGAPPALPEDIGEDLDAAVRELEGWDTQASDDDDWREPGRSDDAAAPAEPAPAETIAAGAGRELRDIASATNPTYKVLRAVLSGRGVRKHGQALLAGIRPILEVVRDHPERARAWITAGATPAPPGDAPPTLVWYRMSPVLFRDLDVFGTGSPLLLLDAPPLEAWSDADWPRGCTLFVPFQDPENVGAVLRTAAAFGVPRVVLLKEAANPFHPKSARVAGGALLRVPMLRGPSIRELAPRGAPVVALSPGGRNVGDFEFPDRFGLLVGLEGPGLPEAWRSATTLGIPMRPGNDSLNAAAACAIVLYLWSLGHGRS